MTKCSFMRVTHQRKSEHNFITKKSCKPFDTLSPKLTKECVESFCLIVTTLYIYGCNKIINYSYIFQHILFYFLNSKIRPVYDVVKKIAIQALYLFHVKFYSQSFFLIRYYIFSLIWLLQKNEPIFFFFIDSRRFVC